MSSLPAPPKDRGGFVLPVALVVMVVLSVLAGAGIHATRLDLRAAVATKESVLAMIAADGGAQRTLAMWSQLVPVLPEAGDSVLIAEQELPDGSRYSSVVYRAPVAAGDPTSPDAIIRTTGRPSLERGAFRTVGMIVTPGSSGPLCCKGAVSVQTRLRVTGSPSDPLPEVDGTDRRPAGWPAGWCAEPLEDVPGIVTSEARSIDQRSNADIAGSPPIVEDLNLATVDFAALRTTTYDDLVQRATNTFVGNQSFRNDVGPQATLGVCNEAALLNWGAPESPGSPCSNHFPIIHVTGELRIRGGGSGQGILLVDDRLRLEDDFRFYGLVIVLRDLQIQGPARLTGGVIVAGGPTGILRSDIQDGGKVAYSSCAVQRAQMGLPAVGGESTPTVNSWFEVYR